MFERFTDRARRVIVNAQEESRLLNHNYIGTEHLLLGLIREEDGVAGVVLRSLNLSLDELRTQIEDVVGAGEHPASGHIPFTEGAKRSLEMALRQALDLGHRYIGTEHLLLGLLAEGGGVASEVLTGSGADLPRVREAVVEILEGGTSDDPSGPFTPERGKVPRCPRCQADLAAVAPRLVAVSTQDGPAVKVLHCTSCGGVIAALPE